MIISDVEYHLVLLPSAGLVPDDKIKSDLAIIIPDVLLQYRGGVKLLAITRDHVHVHFSSSPDVAPKEMADTLIRETSVRLVRVNEKLKGYDRVFLDTFLVKTGAKPTKGQIRDFIQISITGV
ncbi:MAG: transposase [Nitrospinae bacterium]|nr:transposase [Nitrospinota bacterium]